MYILYKRKLIQDPVEDDDDDEDEDENDDEYEYKGTCIKLSIPLLIRLLEYARELSPSDEDLHWIMERVIEHSYGKKVLSMEHYATLVPDKRLVTVEVGPGEKIEVEPINE